MLFSSSLLLDVASLISTTFRKIFYSKKRLCHKITHLPTPILSRRSFSQTEPDTQINALYFYTGNPKGLVLYFHGRGGNLAKQWGKVAEEFTSRGYDFFIWITAALGKARENSVKITLF